MLALVCPICVPWNPVAIYNKAPIDPLADALDILGAVVHINNRQEARRLMFGEKLVAINPGFRVGYEDASHFSREYKRHFGQSPIKDVMQLRQSATQLSEA